MNLFECQKPRQSASRLRGAKIDVSSFHADLATFATGDATFGLGCATSVARIRSAKSSSSPQLLRARS